ncbi:MAG: glycosyltransferase family 4 protein [Isosphaeraceae bacterium]|nr:glycosyltransferase family 4 protein [Isosphaeraceae bacterium]
MSLAISFTNFGPYHLARLRALAAALAAEGRELIAYETAGAEEKYAWNRRCDAEPFRWITLFPGRSLESIPGTECRRIMRERLELDRPEAIAAVGYVRPEGLAMLEYARRGGLPAILMSESQEIDHPHVWWKERVKAERVRKFSSGVVGGPRHRDYLAKLGLPAERVTLGYNAIDHDHFARGAEAARGDRRGLPERPYFVAVSRFVPEKNLLALIDAHASYAWNADPATAWDLVVCGGGPEKESLVARVSELRMTGRIHFPGFLQVDALPRVLANASAFVHPSRSEPWGLVVNEAAACGLPLLVSDRAGAVETFVPLDGSTGRRLDPESTRAIASALAWMSELSDSERWNMGRAAFEIGRAWGPSRFASATLDALEIAASHLDRSRTGRRSGAARRSA